MTGVKVQIADPLSGVVQCPDGDIQYYTTPKIKNKHNPYLNKSVLQDKESSAEYREVECNGYRIIVLAEDIEKALRLECNATVVRFICLLDFIINIFIILNTHYIVGFFIALISMSGYISTITYNRYGLIAYLCYQYIQSISKIGLMIFYIIAATSSSFRIKLQRENIIILNPTSENIIILFIISCGQIYITYFVQSFYNMLKGIRGDPLNPLLS